MKDIKLKRSGYGTYDWSFNGVDVEVVTGRLQLIQSIKHAILLKPDELIQTAYQGKGCKVHDFIYAGNHPNVLDQKAASVEEAVNEIYNVSTSQCTITDTAYDNQINVGVVTTDMEVVNVNEI